MPLRASLDLFDLFAEQRRRVRHRHYVLPAEQLRYLFVKLFWRRHDVFGRHLVENIFQFDGQVSRQPILNRLQFHAVAAIVQLARLASESSRLSASRVASASALGSTHRAPFFNNRSRSSRVLTAVRPIASRLSRSSISFVAGESSASLRN